MVDVMAEMDLCTQLKATLEQRMGKVHDKQGLNDARLQVGAGRRARDAWVWGLPPYGYSSREE